MDLHYRSVSRDILVPGSLHSQASAEVELGQNPPQDPAKSWRPVTASLRYPSRLGSVTRITHIATALKTANVFYERMSRSLIFIISQPFSCERNTLILGEIIFVASQKRSRSCRMKAEPGMSGRGTPHLCCGAATIFCQSGMKFVDLAQQISVTAQSGEILT